MCLNLWLSGIHNNDQSKHLNAYQSETIQTGHVLLHVNTLCVSDDLAPLILVIIGSGNGSYLIRRQAITRSNTAFLVMELP